MLPTRGAWRGEHAPPAATGYPQRGPLTRRVIHSFERPGAIDITMAGALISV